MIKSFTFYADEYNLIDTMPTKDKRELAVAILDYVFKDKIPNLNGHNQAIFNTLSHQLDKSKNKSKNARKSQSNENQNEIKLKSNENQNEIKKGNKTSVLSFKFIVYNFKFNNLINNNISEIEINKLKEVIVLWLNYKKERKELYKLTGLKALLTQIENNCVKYGVNQIINLINECMASNYKGIIFEKLNKQKTPQHKETSSERMARQLREAEEFDRREALKNDKK